MTVRRAALAAAGITVAGYVAVICFLHWDPPSKPGHR